MASQQIHFYEESELAKMTPAARIKLILFLYEQIRQLQARDQEHIARNQELTARNQELERRLNKNSTNSSKPPSSDGPGVQRPQRKSKGGRKQGAQRGHPGHGPELVPESELTEPPFELKPTACGHCGKALHGTDAAPLQHQVVSLPEIKPEVREYRLHRLACRCGHTTCATLPEGVPQGRLDGSVLAFIAFCTGIMRGSKRTTQRALCEFLHTPISLGAVSEAEEKVSAALAEPVAEAVARAQAADVAYVDETRMKIGPRQVGWLWVMVTCTAVVFQMAAKRNRDMARALLGAFRGALVTDRYRVYWVLGEMRQLCWAHLLRDFIALSLEPGRVGQLGAELERNAKSVFRLWFRVRDGTLTRAECRRRARRYCRRIEALLAQGASWPEGGMCRDIWAQRNGLWTFLEQEGVEPTNNGAERALRHAVMWRKCSYGVQSKRGALYLERILTVQATCRLHGRNTWEYLLAACRAHQMGQPIPSLIPAQLSSGTQKSADPDNFRCA